MAAHIPAPKGYISRRSCARGVNIVRSNFPAPSSPAIRDVLYTVINRLKKDHHRVISADEIPIQDPDAIEEEKIRALLKGCNPNLTILYAHGGGLYFSSPTQYRAASARLAKSTGALVVSLKHRLALVHTFPAPILDILLAYTSLLYPPPNAAYPAIPASQIVIAGNSAGANLALGLVKTLLEIQNLPESDRLFESMVILLATSPSPLALPSYSEDSIWPSTPPREVPYCNATTLDHVLVSPAAVEDCTGAPPMWFAFGCEGCGHDGSRVVASQASRADVVVKWNEYEGMPQARDLFESWAKACWGFTEAASEDGRRGKESGMGSGAVRWLMPDCRRVDLGSPGDLAPLVFGEVRRRMRAYNKTRPVWMGKVRGQKL
ncbi:Alpha/Beta hydrolase protein [Aspergillus stella-maris]|uniref:Alpha/Beta hydrolase protein n=1 Tax=Aspergillus stella-maris TaxID=1810926 RepID=UPI003CCE12D7